MIGRIRVRAWLGGSSSGEFHCFRSATSAGKEDRLGVVRPSLVWSLSNSPTDERAFASNQYLGEVRIVPVHGRKKQGRVGSWSVHGQARSQSTDP